MKANKEQLEYLDRLRDSGVTNMFGATPYIQSRFPSLSRREATQVLSDWMETFSTRQDAGEIYSSDDPEDEEETTDMIMGLREW